MVRKNAKPLKFVQKVHEWQWRLFSKYFAKTTTETFYFNESKISLVFPVRKEKDKLCMSSMVDGVLLRSLYLFYFLFLLFVFQPTQQQTRYRKSPYAPSDGEGIPIIFYSFSNFWVLVLTLSFTLFGFLDGGSSPSEDSPTNEWERGMVAGW